jgi:hypothetical protein
MNIGEYCSLTRYLDDVSTAQGGRKAKFAGTLLCGFGYPGFNIMNPDITFIVQLLQSIRNAGQTDLLSEAAEKCTRCPLVESCETGNLMKDG